MRPILLLPIIPFVFAVAQGRSQQANCLDSGDPFCPSRDVDPFCQRAIFNDFIDILYNQKNPTKAFDTYVDVNLTEHDPYDEQGRDANAAKLEGIIPNASFSILHQTYDDNIGFVHLKVDLDPEPAALADIYRLDGSCIVEHWDIVQDRPADATNPIAMF